MNGWPVSGIAADGEEPLELGDLLLPRVLDAVVKPDEQDLANRQRREDRRDREQDHVGREDPRPGAARDADPLLVSAGRALGGGNR